MCNQRMLSPHCYSFHFRITPWPMFQRKEILVPTTNLEKQQLSIPGIEKEICKKKLSISV